MNFKKMLFLCLLGFGINLYSSDKESKEAQDLKPLDGINFFRLGYIYNLLTMKDYNGNPYSDKFIIDYINNYAKDAINLRMDNGYTLLHLATLLRRYGVVECLIKNGANIEAGIEIDIENKIHKDVTPLMLAASVGSEDILKLLLEKNANVEAETSLGWTPLAFSAYSGQFTTWEYLLKLEKRLTDVNYSKDAPFTEYGELLLNLWKKYGVQHYKSLKESADILYILNFKI